ncbi:MAG: N-acetylmuramoyl-L-alanine amidase [Kiritimatiellae bacterium]|nr:N-acetylmuramoyl-L-alanine amidase [Kiritimatiellia bacterium]
MTLNRGAAILAAGLSLAATSGAAATGQTSIAFPRDGQKMPSISRCYVSGAVEPGVTNVVVQGRNVPVHPSGGWVTMVDLVAGTNTIVAGDAQVTVTVAAPPPPRPAGAGPAPEKKYAKLPYAGDKPKAPPKGKAPQEVTVVVDPGHGGSDTGAMSPHGLPEKDANLRLAKDVRDELARRGYRVLMTREDDSFPSLYDRPKLAHRNGADAFISIHHNAPPLDRDPRLVRYHAVYAWNEIGSGLAGAINRRMARAFGAALANNGVMSANFAVTRNPEIPSCLIETDFITTPEGELDCWNAERRRKVAAAIADGFADWVADAGKPSEEKASSKEEKK